MKGDIDWYILKILRSIFNMNRFFGHLIEALVLDAEHGHFLIASLQFHFFGEELHHDIVLRV
jgi:hypothetical protein